MCVCVCTKSTSSFKNCPITETNISNMIIIIIIIILSIIISPNTPIDLYIIFAPIALLTYIYWGLYPRDGECPPEGGANPHARSDTQKQKTTQTWEDFSYVGREPSQVCVHT